MKTRTESLLKKISLAIAGVALTAGCSDGSQVDNPALKYAYLIYSTPGIVSHWLMNETTGTTAFDTLNRNPGTYTFGTDPTTPGITMGVPGPLYGYSNTAIAFSPPSSSQGTTNSGEIIVPYSSSMYITGAMSIEAWMNFAAGTANPQWGKVMWMGTNGSYVNGEGPWGYELYSTTNALSFHLALYNATADTNHTGIGRDLKAFSNTPINDGNWHHIVSTYDPTQSTDQTVICMYIDGQPQTLTLIYYSDPNGNTAGGPFTDPGQLPGSSIAASAYDYLGWQLGLVIAGAWGVPSQTYPTWSTGPTVTTPQLNNQFFNGSFANMAFYNKALTQAQVVSHYNQGKYGHP